MSNNDSQCFTQIEPAGQALLQTADIAFIHLHFARKQFTPRILPWRGAIYAATSRASHAFSVPPLVKIARLLSGDDPCGLSGDDKSGHWNPEILLRSIRQFFKS
jgi:hypothetical protein